MCDEQSSPGCIPGCIVPGPNDGGWCTEGESGNGWCDGRPWKPEQLELLSGKYRRGSSHNEVVLDSKDWGANLPHSVEAFFYPAGCIMCERTVREVHCQFLAAYDLTACDVPLVRFWMDGHLEPFEADSVGCPGRRSVSCPGAPHTEYDDDD